MHRKAIDYDKHVDHIFVTIAMLNRSRSKFNVKEF